MKRSWLIQATKPAGVVIDCDSLFYNHKVIADLWCKKRARDLPNKKHNYRQITAMLRDAGRESHKQVYAHALNEDE